MRPPPDLIAGTIAGRAVAAATRASARRGPPGPGCGVPILSAAEPSGDALAGPVLSELARRRPDLRWTGFGGASMRGVPTFDPLGDVADLSAAGLVEILPSLPRILRAGTRLRRAIGTGPPIAVFVDAPDLHLPLAREARAGGARTVQFVAPQVWAWRPGRARFLARHFDLVLCLFRFEVQGLLGSGVRAAWVGHPLADRLAGPEVPRGAEGTPVLAVLPGSRPAEIARHLGPFVAAAHAALAGRGGEIVVPWRLAARPPALRGVRFETAAGIDVLRRADVALVAAGTASLEAAALGVPQLAAVRVHPASAAIARRLLRTRWVALPNVLLGDQVVPEHVQDLSGVARGLAAMLDDLPSARERAVDVAARLREVLGPPGFALRVADSLGPSLPAAPGNSAPEQP